MLAYHRALAPLLFSLLVLLVGCGGKPATSMPTPVPTPAPQPALPTITVGPVVYLAARPPGLRVPATVEDVTLATSMPELKAMVGTEPSAIWIDVRRIAEVDSAWIQDLYNQRWPIMVIGPEASNVLERLLDLDLSPEAEQVAALRQKSVSGNDVQARWLLEPDPVELVALHRALLSTVSSLR